MKDPHFPEQEHSDPRSLPFTDFRTKFPEEPFDVRPTDAPSDRSSEDRFQRLPVCRSHGHMIALSAIIFHLFGGRWVTSEVGKSRCRPGTCTGHKRKRTTWAVILFLSCGEAGFEPATTWVMSPTCSRCGCRFGDCSTSSACLIRIRTTWSVILLLRCGDQDLNLRPLGL